MKKLTSSTLKQLSVGLLFVAGGLTMVIWLSQSLRFVEMIVEHGATAGMFLRLTMLLIPNLLIITLPIALFIVVTFMFSKLTADRELVVMSAAGLSPIQISKPVLILAGLATAASYFLNLYLLPESYRMFEELKWHIRFSYSQILLEDGRFNTIGDTATVYVRERTSDNSLKGIFVHDTRDKMAPVTVTAKRGSLVKTDEGARIVMFDGSRQVLDARTGKYSVLFFDRYSFNLNEFQKEGDLRTRDSREMSLGQLFDVENQDDIPERDYPKYIVEGHKRLIAPLANITFPAIALVCLFAGGFTRRSQTKRVAVAVVIVLMLQLAMLGAENLSARNASMIPLLYAFFTLPMIASVTLLLRPPNIRFLN